MLITLSILYLILLLVWTRKATLHIASRLVCFVAGLILIFLTALETVSHNLTGEGFNEAVIYHLQYGLEGAGLRDFTFLIVAGSGALLAVILTWIFTFFSSNRQSKKISPLLNFIVAAFFVGIFLQHPTLKVFQRIYFTARSSLPDLDAYIKPQIDERPFHLPNIVWIYGESLERTYMDESEFPGLMPNLKALEAKSLTFTDINQIGSSGWTIAGIVASQCGIPLVTTGSLGNSMSLMPHFLPGATCLGELLKSENYSLSFVGGADPGFAGKGKFLKNHGFDTVSGVHELAHLLEDKSYITDWGTYDDSMFHYASKEFDRLNSSERPFGLFMLTLDTHHPFGHLSAKCKDHLYADGRNSILNSVHCSDKLISDFVNEIVEKNPNTLVVIGSDHLAMPNVAYEKLQKLERRNLLMYYWPDRVNPSVNRRMGDTYSSGATALDLMGFKLEGVGFGRSLISEKPTLRESIADVENVLSSWEPELKKLWKLPERPKSIHIDPTKKFVSFSGSVYLFPIIVDISKTEMTPRLFYDDIDLPLTKVISTLGPETRSIWLDTCDRVNEVFGLDTAADPSTVCLWDDLVQKVLPVISVSDYRLN